MRQRVTKVMAEPGQDTLAHLASVLIAENLAKPPERAFPSSEELDEELEVENQEAANSGSSEQGTASAEGDEGVLPRHEGHGPGLARADSSAGAGGSKKFGERHLSILNEFYKENPNPKAKYLRKIAAAAGLTHLQCKAWFQYQRKKKRKHILENQSESLYREIKVLVEDLEKAKSRNVALLTENTELRKNVNQWNAYQDQLKPSQGATSSSAAAFTTAPALCRSRVGTSADSMRALACASSTAQQYSPDRSRAITPSRSSFL